MLQAMDFLRRNLIVPNLLAALVIFCLVSGGYALASSDVSDSQSHPGTEQLATHSHESKAPKQHGKGHGHHQGHGDQAETEHGGGPPPWAPAHGWRCQQAGNAPGSAAFHECIKAPTG